MTGKKTHLELQKWDTNDLTINSLAWFALPNFCICNEGKGGGVMLWVTCKLSVPFLRMLNVHS